MERSSFENKHLIKNIIIVVVYVLQKPLWPDMRLPTQ